MFVSLLELFKSFPVKMYPSRNLIIFLSLFLLASGEISEITDTSNLIKLRASNNSEVKERVTLTNTTTSSLTISIFDNDSINWSFSLILPCCQELEVYDNVEDTKVDLRNCRSLKVRCGSHHPTARHDPRHTEIPANHGIIDGLTNVTISLAPNSTFCNFTMIASMYFEPPENNCGKYFDCHKTTVLCPNSPNQHILSFKNSNTKDTPRRCIPSASKCNNIPSCGYNEDNVDEADAVCHTAELCQWIFDWMFIVTRSLVAVIFVLIPALVVFLLFQRRQVALQRARLLHERARMESQRNGSLAIITMQNKYVNDLPPTYDDLYDTKDPPPCFCVVQKVSASPVDDFASNNSQVNQAFECTCNNRSNSNSK